jgi:hypothetical protein
MLIGNVLLIICTMYLIYKHHNIPEIFTVKAGFKHHNIPEILTVRAGIKHQLINIKTCIY